MYAVSFLVFAIQTLITFVKCDLRDSAPHSGNQWGRLKDGVMSARRVESGRRTAGISYIYIYPPPPATVKVIDQRNAAHLV